MEKNIFKIIKEIFIKIQKNPCKKFFTDYLVYEMRKIEILQLKYKIEKNYQLCEQINYIVDFLSENEFFQILTTNSQFKDTFNKLSNNIKQIFNNFSCKINPIENILSFNILQKIDNLFKVFENNLKNCENENELNETYEYYEISYIFWNNSFDKKTVPKSIFIIKFKEFLKEIFDNCEFLEIDNEKLELFFNYSLTISIDDFKKFYNHNFFEFIDYLSKRLLLKVLNGNAINLKEGYTISIEATKENEDEEYKINLNIFKKNGNNKLNHPVEGKCVRFGKQQATNDIVFQPSKYISKNQFSINFNERLFKIICKGSNPTCVKIRDNPYKLYKNMVFSLGNDKNVFHVIKISKMKRNYDKNEKNEKKYIDMINFESVYQIDNEDRLEIEGIRGKFDNDKIEMIASKGKKSFSFGSNCENYVIFEDCEEIEDFHLQIKFDEKIGWLIGEKLIKKQKDFSKSGSTIYLKNSYQHGNNIDSEVQIQKGMILKVEENEFKVL